MPDIDKIDRINENEQKMLIKDSQFEIHRLRSLRNLEDFITDYFNSNKRSKGS